MQDADAVLVALFQLARLREAHTVDLAIERDAAGIAIGGSGNIIEGETLIDLAPLPVHVVRACVSRLRALGGPTHFDLEHHDGEIELPHPADTYRFDLRVRLSTSLPDDDPAPIRQRIERAVAACAMPNVPRVARGEHSDAAFRAVEQALEKMIDNGWNNVMLTPGQSVNWPRVVERIRELAAIDANGEGLLDYAGSEDVRVRIVVSDGAYDPEWSTYDEAWIAIRRAPSPQPSFGPAASDTVGDALLAGVLSAPGDAGPLAVYADWLTQQGDRRGEEILRAAPYGSPTPASWLGAIAPIAEHVALDESLGVEIVIDPTRSIDADWSELVTERHWAVVRTLWLRADMARTLAATLLRHAPLHALRHLVLEDDAFATSASLAPCAQQIENLTLVCKRYNPRLAELERVLARGGYPALTRCSLVFPPRSDGKLSFPRAPFRYAQRDIAVETLHMSAEAPLILLQRLRQR